MTWTWGVKPEDTMPLPSFIRLVNERMLKLSGSLGTASGDFLPLNPTTVQTVSGSVAGDKLVFFNNTSATGYGVRFQAGDKTKYGIKVSDDAGVGFFQVFGRRIIQFGSESSSLLTDLLSNSLSSTFLHIEGDSTWIQPGLMLTDGAVTGAGNKVTSLLYMSGGDWGLRLGYNYREPYVGGLSHTDPNLPQNQMAFEQGGSWSIAYSKPYSVVAGTYDPEGGKDLIYYPQGWYSSDGKRLEHTFIGVGNRNRGFDIGVRIDAAGSPDYGTRIRIRSNSADPTNPIYLYVGGSLKQVTEGAADSAGAGFKQLRVPN